MNSSDYIEVTVKLDPFGEENAEILEAMVSDLPYDSFEIGDGVVKCYIQKPLYDRRALRAVLDGVPFRTEFTASEVPFRNWNAEWESSFVPIVVDGTVTVRQVDDLSARRTRYNISLRPEMAFGTGHHDTTYMMMQTMLEFREDIRGAHVTDMGCGTAVLGILAAKMGAAAVCGIDIDAVAAQSAYDNARLNRVGSRLDVRCGDASLLQCGSNDVLLANIHRNIIIMDLPTYARSLKNGGLAFFSGFYDSDAGDVIGEAEKHGLKKECMRSRNGWVCVAMKKYC